MKNIKSIITLFILVFSFQGLIAQAIIDVKGMLEQSGTIIVSAQNEVDYNKVHIKGAINIDIHNLQADVPYKGKLNTTAQVATTLGANGIAQTSKIIVYDEGDMKNAGRLYWILKYMGVADVKVLDGGQKAYMAARKPITKTATNLAATTFTARVNNAIFVDKAYVKSKVGNSNTVLLDVRAASEFAEGACSGSVNMEYNQVIGANGLIKSKEELLALFKAKGITADKEIIVYCATSVRAGIVYLILKDILNFSNVKVFEGAYNEWKAS